MGQKKLIRFEEIKTFPNVFQYPGDMPGKWKEIFHNHNPITLELACGKGEYAIGLGRLHADRNFIGIDLKGNRLWVGARIAIREQLGNVVFMRTKIDQLSNYFLPAEVEELWITFPDPQLRMSKAKKRLTHPRFLRIYQQVMRAGGRINLKTDSPDLYRFTRKVIELYGCTVITDYNDVFNETQIPDELRITTHYESLDIAGSNRIHYLCFTLPPELPGNHTDEALKQWLRDDQRD